MDENLPLIFSPKLDKSLSMTFPVPLNKPLIFFDLETTGLDFKYDHIIEIGALKIYPDGKKESYERRINPGMRIPIEVTKITGISNEDVASSPYLSNLIEELEAFFKDSDIAGYNILRFDAKVMVEEFKRCGRNFNLDERAVIDAQIIFHQKEKRDLSAAYKFYCNKELKDAHSAQADTNATYDIWLSQMKKYKDLPTNIKDLDILCRSDNERFVDHEGKFFWRDGEAVFNFGKHKSKSLRWVTKNDSNYLDWVIAPERNFSQQMVDICYNAMKGTFPKK